MAMTLYKKAYVQWLQMYPFDCVPDDLAKHNSGSALVISSHMDISLTQLSLFIGFLIRR